MTEVRLYYINCKDCGKFLIGTHPLYCGPCYWVRFPETKPETVP